MKSLGLKIIVYSIIDLPNAYTKTTHMNMSLMILSFPFNRLSERSQYK